MNKIPIILVLLVAILSEIIFCYHVERTELDAYVPALRKIKTMLFQALSTNVRSNEAKRFLKRLKRIQEIPKNMTFPCNLNITLRSNNVPTDISRLRPGDIDVIGAMGDSLTAGFGSIATNGLEIVFYEGRGSSFSIGGEGTWRDYLTLPNILKLYNPNIYGFSLDSLSIDKKSKFNVAEGGAISENMPYMAKVLVKRMKNDKHVNLDKDWKLITLLIGDNDFCSEICYKKDFDKVLADHKQDILETLRIFKDNLPRTVVNLIPPINLRVLAELENKPIRCFFTHMISCPCFFGLPKSHLRSKMMEIMIKWQQLDLEIADYPEFHTDDFTVIKDTMSLNFSIPQNSDGTTDYGFLSSDCFHASQRGHARMAKYLWNSMLQPYNEKYDILQNPSMFDQLFCPSDRDPFIYIKEIVQKP